MPEQLSNNEMEKRLAALEKELEENARTQKALLEYHDHLKTTLQDHADKLAKTTRQLARETEKRRQAQQSLIETDAWARTTAGIVSDAIVLSSRKDGRFIFVNEAFCRMTGYGAEEVLGKTPFDLDLVAEPADADTFVSRLEDTGEIREFMSRCRTKDGTLFNVSISSRPMKYKYQQCLISLVKNVTAALGPEEVQDELETLLRQTRETDFFGTLIGGIAHEFNNLLMGIQGNTSLMLLEIDTEHPLFDKLRDVDAYVHSGAKFTKQLLDLAQKGIRETELTEIQGLIKKGARIFSPMPLEPSGTGVHFKSANDMIKLYERVSKSARSVILVDDEEMITQVGRQMLEKLGFEVFVALGGREAIEVFKRYKDTIDLVILDMIMPEMDGGETYDRIKQLKPGIKVLLASGYGLDGQAAAILDRGCNGFIQKPFNIIHLSQKIDEILG